MKKENVFSLLFCVLSLVACNFQGGKAGRDYVDYVNPYIGNISHLLVPTFPTVQLPNSMLRVYPERADYTSERVNGLPVVVTNHRERSAFNLTPFQGDSLQPVVAYNYDNEHIKPYYFDVELNDNRMKAEYALSHQSAVYRLQFEADKPVFIIVNSRNGAVNIDDNTISGYQTLNEHTRVYLYMETRESPVEAGVVNSGGINKNMKSVKGTDVAAVWCFADGTSTVSLRYGISFISVEQAKRNLRRELDGYDVEAVAKEGRDIWNKALGRISVSGGTESDRTVFYSSFYRTFERPICISEDGRYFSAFDGKVHDDGQAYSYYGGGGRCVGAKMKDNMIELVEPLRNMQGLKDFHETTWVHKYNGVYYLSYADNHIKYGSGVNRLNYATSSSPLGPWQYKGVYLQPTGCDTSHGSIVKFKGQWYAFYHTGDYSGYGNLRSVCADSLTINSDGMLEIVKQSWGAYKSLDIYYIMPSRTDLLCFLLLVTWRKPRYASRE